MARARVTVAFLLGAAAALTIPRAAADMPTIDLTAVHQLMDELNTLNQQLQTSLQSLNVLQSVSGFVGDVRNTLGSVTHLTLPIPNLRNMATQIRGDMQCLMPSGVGWGIKLEDINLGSICDTASQYRGALFVDTLKTAAQGLSGGTSFKALDQARQTVEARRNALMSDTVVRSLAQSDVQQQQATNLNNAADDLQSSLDGAQTVQDRLHVLAQIQITQVRAQAAQNQILAQALREEAARDLATGGLSPDLTTSSTDTAGTNTSTPNTGSGQ